MPSAFFIDATARTITQVEVAHGSAMLVDLHRLLGGYIEGAFNWPNRDTLYVDDGGFLKAPTVGFRFALRAAGAQDLAGNGVVVGREIEGEQYPGGYTCLDPRVTIGELRRLVLFGRFD